MSVFKISRIIILVISIVVLAFALPYVYWLVAEQPINRPYIQYSCMLDEFVTRGKSEEQKEYKTWGGKPLSWEEYQETLPLLYFRNLYTRKAMPDSILGVKMDPHDISMTNFTFRINKSEYDVPDYKVYPVFEANHGVDVPELLPYYYQFSKNRVRVLDSHSNTEMKQLSQKFTDALLDNQFQFPPKLVSMNTSTTKQVEYGHYLVDAANHLFNLKWWSSEPLVEIIKLPNREFRIKHIQPVDIRTREFSNVIISQNNEVYLLLNVGNEMQKLPLKNYNPKTDILQFFGNMFHKNILVYGENYTRATVVDPEYNWVDSCEMNWPARSETMQGKWASFLFPFELSMPENRDAYRRVNVRYPAWRCIIFNLILALIFGIIQRSRNKFHLKDFAFEFIVILGFGVFAFSGSLLLSKIG